MPKQYVLKNSPIDRNRLQKLCKNLMEEGSEDRKLALETHRFFRQIVDENPQDATAKNLMVESLKLAQSSKTTTLKVIDLLIKLENNSTKESEKVDTASLFSQLDNLTS